MPIFFKSIRFVIAVILLSYFTPCYAQVPAPTVELSKLYGGSKRDVPTAIIQTKDRGFAIAGWTHSKDGDVTGAYGTSDYDGWVIKTDSAGNLLWNRAIGGSSSDVLTTVAESDSAIIVGGGVWSLDGDLTGIPGPSVRAVIAWLDKTDGSIISLKTYAGTLLGDIKDIKIMSDGNLLVTGTKYNSSLGSGTMWVSLMDNTGTPIWEKVFGRVATSGSDIGYCSLKDSNNYMVAGVTSAFDGDAVGQHGALDAIVVRTDSIGNKIWSKCYGGSGEDYIQAIFKSTDGYILAGTTASPDGGDIVGQHGMNDYWVFKIDTAGNILWSKVIGGTNTERIYGASSTCDGGVLVSGTAQSNDGDVTIAQGIIDFFLVRLSAEGDIEWKQCYGSSTGEGHGVVATTEDSGYAISGSVFGSDGDIGGLTTIGMGDYWLGKLSPDGLNNYCPEPEEPAKISAMAKVANIFVYPNPTTDAFTIETNTGVTHAVITDITGRVIRTQALNTSGKTVISAANLSTGIYYLHFNGTSHRAIHKLNVIND